MVKVFDETAINILPQPGGFIVACRQEDSEEPDKMTVAYNKVSFEKGTSGSISRTEYQLAKFGMLYKMIEKELPNSFFWKAIEMPEGDLFCYLPDGSAKVFDREARVIWQGSITRDGEPAADIVMNGEFAWATFPKASCVSKLSLPTFREEIRIGGKGSGFSNPEGLCLEGERLFICSPGNNKLWEANTKSYNVTEYLDFGEPIYQFVRVGGFKLARLQSGVWRV